MECERLNKLVRSWYVQVQDEALAPARMIEFMEKHLRSCATCLADPDVRSEVKKITEIVLPPSKMVKLAKEDEEDEGEEDEERTSYDEDEEGEGSTDDNDEEDVFDDDDEEGDFGASLDEDEEE